MPDESEVLTRIEAETAAKRSALAAFRAVFDRSKPETSPEAVAAWTLFTQHERALELAWDDLWALREKARQAIG